jgi:DNA invertase Pin-like site-specific DNA recombinase
MKTIRCAIYTRKSTEDGLDKEFNTLEAQRESGENYVKSQAYQGWEIISTHYDDGGYSGGTLKRPALQQLLQDVENGMVDMIVVYKIDRLTRSLIDFAKLVEVLDRNQCSFVSVTQNFNTYDSMGRLTLNVLLSFAQFEREVITERIRDKVNASKKKGMWMGGFLPIGYFSYNPQVTGIRLPA